MPASGALEKAVPLDAWAGVPPADCPLPAGLVNPVDFFSFEDLLSPDLLFPDCSLPAVLVKGPHFFSSAGLTRLCSPPTVRMKAFDVDASAKAAVAVAKGDEVVGWAKAPVAVTKRDEVQD
jgi:hypothetical protein